MGAVTNQSHNQQVDIFEQALSSSEFVAALPPPSSPSEAPPQSPHCEKTTGASGEAPRHPAGGGSDGEAAGGVGGAETAAARRDLEMSAKAAARDAAAQAAAQEQEEAAERAAAEAAARDKLSKMRQSVKTVDRTIGLEEFRYGIVRLARRLQVRGLPLALLSFSLARSFPCCDLRRPAGVSRGFALPGRKGRSGSSGQREGVGGRRQEGNAGAGSECDGGKTCQHGSAENSRRAGAPG